MSKIILLAQIDRFREMGNNLRGERATVHVGDLISLGVMLLAVIAFIVVLSRSLAKQDRRAKYNSPKALFKSLCQAHSLNRADCRLLKQLARGRKLAHPAQVFLQPTWFEATNLSAGLKGRAPQLTAIARRIFAEPPPGAVEKEAAAVDAIIDV